MSFPKELNNIKESESIEITEQIPSKISNLKDLRALKKAEKLSNGGDSNRSNNNIINSNNAINNPLFINFQRTTSPLRGLNGQPNGRYKQEKSPEEESIYALRTSFKQSLSKLYTSETKDLVIFLIYRQDKGINY